MPESGIRAVFFDLDGTLADTAPDLGGALNELRAERGRPLLEMAVLRPHVSAGTRGMLGVGFGLKPHDAGYDEHAKRFLELYAQRLCVDTRLFEGMPEVLQELERRRIAWGIVTNKPARFTEPLAECLKVGGRATADFVRGRRPARHPGRPYRRDGHGGCRLGLSRRRPAHRTVGRRCRDRDTAGTAGAALT